eukprot:jgi/Hompol1/1938/HPOL_001410-RA
MKFLPYIDHILVKTQFLVFNNQFLDNLGLVKVMMYDLMKCHFNYHHYPGISYEQPPGIEDNDKQYQKDCVELVKELDESLRAFNVKLGAAYARLRIEKRAAGDTTREQMENILPPDVREKEMMAVEMPKTLKVNPIKLSKSEVAQQLEVLGYKVDMRPMSIIEQDNVPIRDSLICLDDDFDDMLVIPPSSFADIKASRLVSDASVYGTKHLASMVSEGVHVIDARAGCDVVIVEEDFAFADIHDPRFAQVSAVVVEPSNSGTAIVDKLGFMLQEEEFPNSQHSLKDLYSLKRQQVAILKHAFKFLNVRVVMYITRSIHPEENEQVVQETLDRYGVEWEMSCVLPSIVVDRLHDYEIDECLTIHPSEQAGNGVFIACFQKKAVHKTDADSDTEDGVQRRISSLNITDLDSHAKHLGNKDATAANANRQENTRRKRRTGSANKSKPRITAKIKLPKGMSETIQRLSVPRTVQLEQKKQKLEQQLSKLRLRRSLAGENGYNQAGKDAAGLRLSDHDPEDGAGDGDWQDDGAHDYGEYHVPGSRSHRIDKQFSDISVFGISLSKFYGPRMEAMKRIQAEDMKAQWSYPVSADMLMLYRSRVESVREKQLQRT